ncbi:barstar family protein [Nonomuraea cavernae]|uniref:barstar family protein n=1 Tax=Nonomuraea cavernae TaxID=2045107 RepID=UPI0033FF9FEB
MPRELHIPRGDVNDVELHVIDFRGERIGSYYIGRIWLGASTESAYGADFRDITSSFYGHACLYPHAGEIWRRWASGKSIEPSEWSQYPRNSHASWLHVVQTAWFESGHSAIRYGMEDTVAINGGTISSTADFYCAIGEAVNGAGGYFGSSLDSLADCLSSSWESRTSFRIIWNDSSVSCEFLEEEFVMSVLTLMQEHGVEVSLR